MSQWSVNVQWEPMEWLHLPIEPKLWLFEKMFWRENGLEENRSNQQVSMIPSFAAFWLSQNNGGKSFR